MQGAWEYDEAINFPHSSLMKKVCSTCGCEDDPEMVGETISYRMALFTLQSRTVTEHYRRAARTIPFSNRTEWNNSILSSLGNGSRMVIELF